MYPSINKENSDSNSSPSEYLRFKKSDFTNASLVCSTILNDENQSNIRKLDFGFTAEKIFYRSDSCSVKQIKFLHDRKILQIFTNLKNGLRLDIRYSSFVKLNFKIPISSFEQSADDFEIELILIFNSTPFFYKKENEEFRRVNCEESFTNVYWKKLIYSTAFKMNFRLKKSQMNLFFYQLYSNVKCSFTYIPMTVDTFIPFEEIFRDVNFPWEIQYIIKAIKSLGTVGDFYLNIHENPIKLLYKQVNGKINFRWTKMYLSSMYEHLRNDISLSKLNFEEKIQKEPLKGFVFIKMVYITPTRIILGIEEAVKDSRGIRILKPENLIQVKFRDETFSTFPLECVEQIFLRYCLGGINIAGRQFHEFGGSSSLFREHGSYFYATNDETDIIKWWQKFGHFKIEAPSKVGARIGQYFTSAMQITMKVRQSNVQVLSDIMSNIKDSAGNLFCFSDGVGTISPDFAAQISRELQLSYIPSAFQIRYAGYKGMVFIDKEDYRQDRQLFGNGGKYLLCFRKSQQKFIVENNDEYLDFDIVNFSTPTPANLFPVFTAMLDSLAYCGNTRKKLHERLRQLQYQRFLEIIKPLAINAQFIKTLKTLPQYFPISAIEDKFLIDEPFLRSMIEAKAVSNAKLMMSKCQLQLPMSLARAVFGIMDPTGFLNHGEIFFKYSEPSSLNTKTVLIQEKVGITKSPIYHAGDIRFLRAVDVPALHHLSDVLVFPSRGFRPHPDEIGGGDLDGDTYIIFWDPALIPNWEAPSADYTAPSAEHIEKVDLHNLQDKHPHFRVQYSKENNLEQISTCHLAHLVTHQPFHKDCTKIAKKGEISVNFFKSGLVAEPLEEQEKPGYWPKFMIKSHEPAFTNSHILSEFHERATSFCYLIQNGQNEARKRRKIQDNLKPVQITEFAKDLFLQYKAETSALMEDYQIVSEGNLFACTFLDIFALQTTKKLHLENERLTATIIQEKVFKLFEKYRKIILNKFIPNWEADIAAMNQTVFSYQMPYTKSEVIRTAHAFYEIAEKDGTCYSFPWIIWEGLQDKWRNATSEECKNIALEIERETSEVRTLQNSLCTSKINSSIFGEYNYCYPWFTGFIEIINNWLNDFPLAPVIDAIWKYMTMDLKNDNNAAGTNFIAFISIIAESRHFSIVSDNYQKLYEKAHSTFIKLAFLPDNKILTGINLQNQIINYQTFVVAVPKFWSESFQNCKYILKAISECHDVAVGLRKTANKFDYFTIMCRGTLEACRKLQSFLTPVIEEDFNISIADMKVRKIQTMKDLLQDVFEFLPVAAPGGVVVEEKKKGGILHDIKEGVKDLFGAGSDKHKHT